MHFYNMKLALTTSPVWLKVSLSVISGTLLGCLLGEMIFNLLIS